MRKKVKSEKKKYKSVVQKIVIWPLTVMSLIAIVTIVSIGVTLFHVQKQIVDSNMNSLSISQSQLENLLNQLDRTYVEYWNSNQSYRRLRNCTKEDPIESYFTYRENTRIWMETLKDSYTEIEGVFCYFPDIEVKLFRGASNFRMHDLITKRLEDAQGTFNHWEIVNIDEECYLINIKKYGNFYGGVWIYFPNLERDLSLAATSYRGTVFLKDYLGNTTLNAEEQNLLEAKQQDVRYAEPEKQEVMLGIIVNSESILMNIPPMIYLLLILAFASIALIPMIVIWLRKKIAGPMREIDEAMHIIGEGNVDYRIQLKNRKTEDEFDRLSQRINQTMDELNEISFSLYEAKIREQEKTLQVYSQQIRPHFILNALNVIYVCEESDFPLIKKMVLYLTDYFRYVVNIRKNYVELCQEIHFVEAYLNIQKERYVDRLDFFVEWEMGTEKILVPPIIIQTFVENSIKYGMLDGKKNFIYVLASIVEGRLKVMIADSGKGFDADLIEAVEQYKRTGVHQEHLGIGIENAIERIRILYGEGAGVCFRNALSGGAVVEIYLPIKEGCDV
ncbi:MAG: HAMP domain-containing protein [Lachnospiraceae bacterium]|nr:HAMP domain-containing protein [Lachnospiraceae bacterium]